LYAAFIPLVMNKKVLLIDNKKMKLQLANLERRTGSEGREKITHPSGYHDDLANVAAGACFYANFGEKDSGAFAEQVGMPLYGPGSDEGAGGFTSFDDWLDKSRYPK